MKLLGEVQDLTLIFLSFLLLFYQEFFKLKYYILSNKPENNLVKKYGRFRFGEK